MIKAIILDIDGVIVGEKIGFNSPNPHTDVLDAMKKIHANGIPIALCTAKPHYAIRSMVQDAGLNNPQITDAGAVIIDPIDNLIIAEHIIEKELVKEVLETCLKHGIYVEVYTTKEYFIQESQVTEMTKKHTHILQTKPQIVSSLVVTSLEQNITKIMPIAFDDKDQERISKILEPFSKELSISWGVHRIALPAQFGIITALGSSKKEGAEAVIKNLHISFEEVLGVGDSTSDWSFMQLCGYGATLANGTEELKKLLKSKGEGKYFVSNGSVDENGILEIFKHFSL